MSLATVIGSGLNSAIHAHNNRGATNAFLSEAEGVINSAPGDYELFPEVSSDEEDEPFDINHNQPLLRERGGSVASIRSTKVARFVRTFSKAFPGIASVKLPFKGAHVSSVLILNTITDISFITLGGIGLQDNSDNT